ncbi:molybdenum cofactor guanylyltransferase [Devosia sp. BK]|uniref:molybdenum cofactor guanylyltransferase n=1 Tax=Devosia sp. BK TaxID=2871706 RepID=UPI00293B24B6|nr:molybdenum cofactor guanylyltransferase [Devosia sp. BK]MDV3251040.1 molybdenum cofactor guanylyltransferase [Devosia sp. BK]
MTKVFGIILAGGSGTRLGGVRKADIRIGGKRLIDRATGVFRGQVSKIAVSAPVDFAGDELGDAVLIRDGERERRGPLAGLTAAAHHFADRASPADILVFLAVDTPFAPDDYVYRLTQEAEARGSALATWGNALYPTNSAVRLSHLLSGLESVAPTAGPRAILNLLEAQTLDWSDRCSEDPFANLNTLADLIALQRRALRDLDAVVRQPS